MILALHSVVLEEGQSSVTLHYSFHFEPVSWYVQDRIRIGFGRWQEIDKLEAKSQSKVQVQVESKKRKKEFGIWAVTKRLEATHPLTLEHEGGVPQTYLGLGDRA